MKRGLIAVALLLAPALGHAQLLGSAEVFYSDTEFDFKGPFGGQADADGYGVRGLIKLPGSGLYFRGAYIDETVETPFGDFDYNETRLGAGLGFSPLPVLDLGIEAEYGSSSWTTTAPTASACSSPPKPRCRSSMLMAASD